MRSEQEIREQIKYYERTLHTSYSDLIEAVITALEWVLEDTECQSN